MIQVEDLRSCKGDLSKLTVPIVANASAAINLNGGGKLGGTPSLQPQQGLTAPSSTATSATSAGTSSPSKPYKCAHCDYTTANKLTIYEHCAKKHSVKASVNDIQVSWAWALKKMTTTDVARGWRDKVLCYRIYI